MEKYKWEKNRDHQGLKLWKQNKVEKRNLYNIYII